MLHVSRLHICMYFIVLYFLSLGLLNTRTMLEENDTKNGFTIKLCNGRH